MTQSAKTFSRSILFSAVSLGLFILSLYPLRLWPLNWLAWGFLIAVILDRSLSWRQFTALIYYFSIILFTYIGWKIYFYDIQVCLLSIGTAILSFLAALLLLRWISLQTSDPSNALILLPCAWILIHFLSEYLPLATITLDILFDAPLVLMQAASLAGIKLYHAALLGLLSALVIWIKKKIHAKPKPP